MQNFPIWCEKESISLVPLPLVEWDSVNYVFCDIITALTKKQFYCLTFEQECMHPSIFYCYTLSLVCFFWFFSSLLQHTSGSICSTPKLSGGIPSSQGTSCAYTEPDKMPCKQSSLIDSIPESCRKVLVTNDNLGLNTKKGKRESYACTSVV